MVNLKYFRNEIQSDGLKQELGALKCALKGGLKKCLWWTQPVFWADPKNDSVFFCLQNLSNSTSF